VAPSEPRIKTDLHTHTISSGHGYSTVREICSEAQRRGIEMIGVTDHGPAMPGGPHVYHFTNLVVMPRMLSGVKILRSAECNIIDADGGLDLDGRVLDILDIVHAGMHPFTGYEGASVEDNTRALLGAINGGRIDVLVHPGNPRFPFDHRTVIEAATSKGVLLEINNSSFTVVRKGSIDNCRLIITEAMRSGAGIVVGTDAHDASGVGVYDKALELVDEVGFPEDRIVNRDAESVLRFLKERGRKDILFS